MCKVEMRAPCGGGASSKQTISTFMISVATHDSTKWCLSTGRVGDLIFAPTVGKVWACLKSWSLKKRCFLTGFKTERKYGAQSVAT